MRRDKLATRHAHDWWPYTTDMRYRNERFGGFQAGYDAAMSDAMKHFKKLYSKVKHGDQEHRTWLKNAINEHLAQMAKLEGDGK